MSKLHITVTNEGKKVVDSDCDALIVGFLNGSTCDTLDEAPDVTNGQMAMMITSLLQHIEVLTDENTKLPGLILVLNKMMDKTEVKDDGEE